MPAINRAERSRIFSGTWTYNAHSDTTRYGRVGDHPGVIASRLEAKTAEAAGVLGLKANVPEQVRPMLAQALSQPGPALVEVVVNRQELIVPPSVKLDQVMGFSLFLMKAVINGRGNEVIDLLKTNLF